MTTVPSLNDPSPYYSDDSRPSLAWEMTVCQSLSQADDPCQRALRAPRRYGELLADFLAARLKPSADWGVVEVGGGYGSLMGALLSVIPFREVTMVDLSPFFLDEQRKALGDRCRATFVCANALEYFRGLDGEVDLVVSNENVGDFPTAVGLSRREILRGVAGEDLLDPLTARVAAHCRRFGLDLTDAPESFAFNLGAVEFLEALAPRARAVFLSEHSADAAVPAPFDEFVALPPSNGYPRRVSLRGHDEYTIKFSHLEQVAKELGYEAHRFPLMALLGLRDDEEVRTMVRAPNTLSETAEIVHEFFHHVAEYQVLLLVRGAAKPSGGTSLP